MKPSCSSVPRFLLGTAAFVSAAVSAVITPQLAQAQTTVVVDDDGRATATNCDANQPAFSSIQAAVDAAGAGSRILVCPGTYAEQVVVTKNNLTIRGSGQGLTVLRPSALPVDPGSPATGAPRKAILLVNGATGVTVAQLTIDGSAADGGATNFANCGAVGFTLGIYYRNSSGTVDSTHTTNMRSDVLCSAGIFADSGSGGAANLIVKGNTVDKYGQAGVVCNGENTACTVTGNTLRGRGPVDDEAQAGIVIRLGAVAWITENTVRGHVCTHPFCGRDPINEVQAAGINVFLSLGASGTHISENRVSDNDIGIYQLVSADCCTISENRVTNSRFFGIVIQDVNGTTSQNTIRGGEVGIAVVAGGENTVAVLREDEISGTSVAPVREIDCCGFTATASVEDD
jgi:parallel beta-helix repeat protein